MSTFWAQFAAAAERWPERTAYVEQRRDGVAVCSYRRLRQRAEAAAVWLAASGLGRGECCVLIGENSVDWVAACLAVLRLGAVVVPVDRNYAAAPAASLIGDCGARLVLASQSCLALARDAARHRRPAPVVAPLAAPAPAAALPPAVVAAPDDPAMILYTSGTTAEPKGVVLTGDNLAAAIAAMYGALPFNENDCSLGALPFSHILGQMAGMLLPLPVGAAVVLLEELSPEALLRGLREQHVTVLCGVPQLFVVMRDRILGEIRRRGSAAWLLVRLLMVANAGVRRLLGRNCGRHLFRPVHQAVGPRLRFMVSAGAPLDPAVVRDFQALGFMLLEAYGLTETTGAVTMTPLGSDAAGHVGVALGGGAAAVLAADGTPAATGAEGEIALRGRMLTAGYYNRPEATAAAIVDGWLRTGDLGRIDRRGRLHVTGRKKDLIVLASGKKVQPEEIEHRLIASPLIAEVCVLARRSAAGESLHAVIVPDMQAFRERGIGNLMPMLRHEIDSLSAAAPSWQLVPSLSIRGEPLPRTPTRKIRRHLVGEELDAALAAATGPRLWSPVAREWRGRPGISSALGLVENALGCRALHPDDSLELDCGIDSLRRLELAAALEEIGGINIDNAAMLGCYTVRDLAEAIAGAPAQTAGEPDEAEESDLDLTGLGRAGLLLDVARFLVLKVLGIIARLLFRLELHGGQYLPRQGPFILAVNHQSFLDAPIVLSALPYALVRRTVMLGKPKYVGGGWRGRLAARLNIVAIDADASLPRAMHIAEKVLRHGHVLLLFPEGERSIDGELRPLRRGAATLACRCGVPIVPVVIEGTHRIWPRGRRPQRLGRVRLCLTAPLQPPPAGADGPEAAAGLTRRVEERMRAELAGMQEPPPQAAARPPAPARLR